MNQFHPYTKLILLIAVAIFASCSRSKSTQGGDYIDINNIEKVSFYDVYDSIEIIPLETTEESILIYRQTKPAKMVLHDDKFYILDENKIFIFDSNGKYISKINKQGRGRGEYSEISDFNINMFTGDIEILSPTGVINIYDKNSLEYRQKIEIQTSNNAYHAFHCLTEDIYILYSAYSEDRQILLYSISKAELIGDTYHAPTWLPQAGLSYSTSPFYTIGESLCFVQAYDGQVFNLGEQPPYINTKYQWDFGRATINIDNIPPDRDYKFYLDYFKSGNKFVTHFVQCLENSNIFITCFTYKSKWYQMIYDKRAKSHTIFQKFEECKGSIPIIIDDNYAYSSNIHRYTSINEKLLDQKNLSIYNSLSDDDNPVIVKYKFKR